jgi:hypothetical protein
MSRQQPAASRTPVTHAAVSSISLLALCAASLVDQAEAGLQVVEHERRSLGEVVAAIAGPVAKTNTLL